MGRSRSEGKQSTSSLAVSQNNEENMFWRFSGGQERDERLILFVKLKNHYKCTFVKLSMISSDKFCISGTKLS